MVLLLPVSFLSFLQFRFGYWSFLATSAVLATVVVVPTHRRELGSSSAFLMHGFGAFLGSVSCISISSRGLCAVKSKN